MFSSCSLVGQCDVLMYRLGTTVTLSLVCPENETRCVATVDMTQMNQILWVDEKNLLARIGKSRTYCR